MSFVRARRPLAASPISFTVYDENGNTQKIEFVAQYHRHEYTHLADLQDAMVNRAREAEGKASIVRDDGTVVPKWPYATDLEFIQDKMAGWRGMTESNGTPTPFCAEGVAEFVQDYPEAIVPLFDGFFQAHRQAREKN